MQTNTTKRHALFVAISATTLSLGSLASQGLDAQQAAETSTMAAAAMEAPTLEEMMVVGRQQSGAQSILQERMEDAFSADLMGSDQISRTGDANVAIALTRVTGVTLNQGKYVYVRGLGERYSSVLLNGAAVPSPELTRNVLPLDIIPSSIVDNLKIQKSYSPDLPAHFGGGNVDIRTKTVPDELVLDITLGTGSNTNNDRDDLTYSGGDAQSRLPEHLANALDTYQGRVNVDGIIDILDTDGGTATPAERQLATEINRNLMLSLNRNLHIYKKKSPYDRNGAIALGDAWSLGDDWTIGGIINWSQKTEWRNKNQTRRGVGAPDDTYAQVQRTLEDTKELASAGVGINYQDAHKLQLSHMRLGNISEEAAITLAHNSNNQLTDGRQKITYETRYQDRELEVTQALGNHSVDELAGAHLGQVDVDWFYSDSQVETNIPGAATLVGDNIVDPTTGALISTALSANSSHSFSYLNLQDDVESYGWNLSLPLTFDTADITFSTGYSYNDKARSYYGYTPLINVGGGDVLNGMPSNVFTHTNITNLSNDFELTMSRGFGTESYIAATMTEAIYGMVDATWNDQWRVTAGARYEDHRRALIPVDLLDYTGVSIEELIKDLQQDDQTYATRDDSWQPSLAFTFMQDGFMNTETFQLRASYAQTLIRPDLRELSDVTYIDPELAQRVQGNPYLKDSTLDHFELRSEWYFDSGNNLTASLFYKDIADPIEQFRKPGSDEDIVLSFYNADAGEIYGLELEGLLNLERGFFVSGNLTLADSEIVSTDTNYTNPTRRMTGQSPYVLNAQLGYDSENEMHSAALSYNVAGEKIYFAAYNTNHDDAFEQPFSSLDFTYSFFPTSQITLKAKLRNLLDQDREITQTNSSGRDVTILTQEVGTSYSLDLNYKF